MLIDWDMSPLPDDQDGFFFEIDGYTLCVVAWHDWDKGNDELHWGIDDYFLVNENGNIIRENTGISEDLMHACSVEIEAEIGEKLNEFLKRG